ncbi:hypothetical protein Ddye_010815 [Dipteronia dyeriana]|uniref:Protein kinase domain-containing protein n=1 Tax=Dipteronia dyeriana TaxID=168575 RepID=A0AAE0CP63_9ROSI|nr:hypothetical protein Ddye_010815 [Dipteronia dyeriana]
MDIFFWILQGWHQCILLFNLGSGEYHTIIGRINFRDLVTLWGFCAENEHKLLVYKYVENGSLHKILLEDSASIFGWDHLYNMAVGTAKGLSYLHEECLEWVLHCDMKPQNILLDDQLQPKVANFGMPKLSKTGTTQDAPG